MSAFKKLVQTFLDPEFQSDVITLKTGVKVHVCRHMDINHVVDLDRLLKNGISLSIPLIISFMQHCTCGVQGVHKPNFPDSVIDRFKVSEDIADVVKRFFIENELEPFRTKMDDYKKRFAQILTEIRSIPRSIEETKVHLAEYTSNVDQLREEAKQLQAHLEKSKMHFEALQNLVKANEKASQLFGSELATLDPNVFRLLEEWEPKTNALSDLFSKKMKDLSYREKMVSDTLEAIQILTQKLPHLQVAEKQAHTNFTIAEKEFWKKVNEFPLHKLPSDLSQPKKAAEFLSGVMKRASSQAIMNSRLKLTFTEC